MKANPDCEDKNAIFHLVIIPRENRHPSPLLARLAEKTGAKKESDLYYFWVADRLEADVKRTLTELRSDFEYGLAIDNPAAKELSFVGNAPNLKIFWDGLKSRDRRNASEIVEQLERILERKLERRQKLEAGMQREILVVK